MCFSADASLAAGAMLVGTGVVTLRMARRRELPYAAIPLLFGIQQLTEAMVWLSFDPGREAVNTAATYVYSIFSHVLWPVYVPIAVWLMEEGATRRRALRVTAAAGSLAGLALLYSLLTHGIAARVVGEHIVYDAPRLFIPAVMTLYLAATAGSLLLSRHRKVRLFGVLAFVSSVVAYTVYARWFISVWCFFAALLSLVVVLQLMETRPTLVASRA
jgi:hypothetical protein